MRTLNKNKLFKYSAAATTFLTLASEAEGQIVYTDLEPDHELEVSYYDYEDIDSLDINGNGINDFYVYLTHGTLCGYCGIQSGADIRPLYSNAAAYHLETVFSYCSSDTWVLKIADHVTDGDTIGDEVFTNNQAIFFFNDAAYDSCPFSFAGGEFGTAFIPIQLTIDGNIHYGWIRCSVTGNITIYDYAFNATPGEYLRAEVPISTGGVLWEFAEDISDNTNGTDLQCSFLKSDNEDSIQEYRVIAVKASAPELSTGVAALLNSDQYISIIPDGSDSYTQSFLEGSKDSDGDLLTTNIAYKLYVLNYAIPGSGVAHSLSAASDTITLHTPIANMDVLLLEDISDNGNASDLHIEFSPSSTEEVISEYRIMLSENDSATLDALLTVPAENYIAHTPDGSFFSTTFSSDMKEANGETITYGRQYYAYVLMIDNGLSTGSKFMRSDPLFLNGPTGIATELLLYDIGDMENVTDVLITFYKAADETTVQAYRTMLVPESFASMFDLAYAESLPEDRYFDIIPDGEHVAAQFPDGLLDVEGNEFHLDVSYVSFVLSIPSEIGSQLQLSEPSNSIIFPTELSIQGNVSEQINIIYEKNLIQIILPYVPASNYQFELHGLDGKKLFEKKIVEMKTTFEITLPQGIYIGNLHNELTSYTRKIIVQ